MVFSRRTIETAAKAEVVLAPTLVTRKWGAEVRIPYPSILQCNHHYHAPVVRYLDSLHAQKGGFASVRDRSEVFVMTSRQGVCSRMNPAMRWSSR